MNQRTSHAHDPMARRLMKLEDMVNILEAGMPQEREALADLGEDKATSLGQALAVVAQRESLGAKKPAQDTHSCDANFSAFLARMGSAEHQPIDALLASIPTAKSCANTDLVSLVRQADPDATTDTIARALNLPPNVFRIWSDFVKVAAPIFKGRVRRLLAQNFGLLEEDVDSALKRLETPVGVAFASSSSKSKRSKRNKNKTGSKTRRRARFTSAKQAMEEAGFTKNHELEWEDIVLGRPLGPR